MPARVPAPAIPADAYVVPVSLVRRRVGIAVMAPLPPIAAVWLVLATTPFDQLLAAVLLVATVVALWDAPSAWRGEPRIAVTDDGVVHSGWGAIPWERIEGVRIERDRSGRHLSVYVRDLPELLARQARHLTLRTRYDLFVRNPNRMSVPESVTRPVRLEQIRDEIDRRAAGRYCGPAA
jgi:hypothetical protein